VVLISTYIGFSVALEKQERFSNLEYPNPSIISTILTTAAEQTKVVS
jgi:hypothetical protein